VVSSVAAVTIGLCAGRPAWAGKSSAAALSSTHPPHRGRATMTSAATTATARMSPRTGAGVLPGLVDAQARRVLLRNASASEFHSAGQVTIDHDRPAIILFSRAQLLHTGVVDAIR
jgi:hypothetical protein